MFKMDFKVRNVKLNKITTYNTTPKAINSIFGYTGTDLNVTNTTMSVGSTAQVYDLVIFLKENNKNQNIDQGQVYNGSFFFLASY